MNKHEEARNNAFNILPKSIGSKSSQLKLKYYFEVDRYIKQSEATEKELEEIKSMIKEIGDSGISFDTSQQRVVFEALMNKIGRLSKAGEDK